MILFASDWVIAVTFLRYLQGMVAPYQGGTMHFQASKHQQRVGLRGYLLLGLVCVIMGYFLGT